MIRVSSPFDEEFTRQCKIHRHHFITPSSLESLDHEVTSNNCHETNSRVLVRYSVSADPVSRGLRVRFLDGDVDGNFSAAESHDPLGRQRHRRSRPPPHQFLDLLN